MRHFELLKARYRAIFSYIGVLSIGIGCFLLLPLLCILFYPDSQVHVWDFALPAMAAILFGFILWILCRSHESPALTLPEGGIIVFFGWMLAIGFSSLPFILSSVLSPLNGIFEAVSGWTTTGLTVIKVSDTPPIFLLWRSLMQFLGGAGLAVIMLSTIIGPHGLGLYQAEGRTEQLLPHVRRSAKMVLTIYLGYTLTGIILYLLAGMNLFDAVNHSLSALSTGGFSTQSSSIGGFKSPSIELITSILMVLGSINFAVHFTLLRGRLKLFIRSGEIQLTFFFLATFIPLVFFFSVRGLYRYLTDSWRIAFFNTISALSTTGYSTGSFKNWNDFGILCLIFLMIIGGGICSTAGGIKQYRIYLLLKSIWWGFSRHFIPRSAVVENYIWREDNKFYVDASHIKEVANYVFLYVGTYFVGVMIFLSQGYPLRDSMFEFASALGTVGLSVGITGPEAPVLIRSTEMVGMILGRLEFLVIFFALFKIFKDIFEYLRSEVPL